MKINEFQVEKVDTEPAKINWNKLVEITKASFLGMWKMAPTIITIPHLMYFFIAIDFEDD